MTDEEDPTTKLGAAHGCDLLIDFSCSREQTPTTIACNGGESLLAMARKVNRPATL